MTDTSQAIPRQSVLFPLRELRGLLHGSHACIAGSAVAAETYSLPHSYDDIDVFAYGNSSLISIASILLASLYGVLEGIAGVPRVSMAVVSVVMIVIGFLSVGVVQRRYT